MGGWTICMHAMTNMCTTSDGKPTSSRRLGRPSCNAISAKRSLDTELQIKAYEINVILKFNTGLLKMNVGVLTTQSDYTRSCIHTIVHPRMSTYLLETRRGFR
jgi:hypothetical protein